MLGPFFTPSQAVSTNERAEDAKEYFERAGNYLCGGGGTATFWRNLALAAAILISLAAAVFSGLQWFAMRDQVFVTTKPHVDFDIEDDSDEPMVGIAIKNAGPGPAVIKAITF